ncbi:MAG: hypothetical protein K2W95_17455 [Candidatus Obscuribacterales bacterium]|nr:hypothetical protein [Candidatus Obscuribacterales bacterium]
MKGVGNITVGLDNIVVSAPCSMSWDSMSGDDRVRACNGCNKYVYNLSSMTKPEAESFLAQYGVSQCMRFYRRKDGTIMTDDCPVGLRGLRDRYRSFWKLLAALCALIVGQSQANAQDASSTSLIPSQSSSSVGGGVSCPPPLDRIYPLSPVTLKLATPSDSATAKPRRTVYRKSPATANVTNSMRSVVKLRATKAQVAPAGALDRADKTAQDLFEKGLESESEGKSFVAQVYYKNALAAMNPANVDVKFQFLVKGRLQALQRKSGIAEH